MVNRWLQKYAQNYHRGVVFCGGCGILCGCVILCSLRYALWPDQLVLVTAASTGNHRRLTRDAHAGSTSGQPSYFYCGRTAGKYELLIPGTRNETVSYRAVANFTSAVEATRNNRCWCACFHTKPSCPHIVALPLCVFSHKTAMSTHRRVASTATLLL